MIMVDALGNSSRAQLSAGGLSIQSATGRVLPSGYVFNNVHNIQAGVPPENIVALYDAAYEFGFRE